MEVAGVVSLVSLVSGCSRLECRTLHCRDITGLAVVAGRARDCRDRGERRGEEI